MSKSHPDARATWFRLSEASWAQVAEEYKNGATAAELGAKWKVSARSLYRPPASAAGAPSGHRLRPPRRSLIFLTNGLGFLGRRRAPGVSRGPFCFLGEDFQAVRRQLGPQDIERPVLLGRTQGLQPNRARHQIGQLQAG